MIEKLNNKYGSFFEATLISEIKAVGALKNVVAGTQLMHIGQYIKNMSLVLSGTLKIMREDQEGDFRSLCPCIGLYDYLGRSHVVSIRIYVYLCYIFDPRNDPPYGI